MSHRMASYAQGPPALLGAREVADLLGVSRRTVWRLADAGALPRVHVAQRAVRYRLEDVEALIEKGFETTNRPVDTPDVVRTSAERGRCDH